MTAAPTAPPTPTYRGGGKSDANLGAALHDALENARTDDPGYKVGKEYRVGDIFVKAGNPHVKTFRVTIED